MALPTNAESVAQLADLLAQVSAELLDYRIVNKSKLKKDRLIQIEDAETTLDGLVAILRGTATRLIADEARQPLDDLKTQIAHANAVIARVNKIKAVMNLVAALVTVAASIVAGDVKGFLGAIEGLKKASDAADKSIAGNTLNTA